MVMRWSILGAAVALVGLSAGGADATQITFDGGLAYLHSGGPIVTSNIGASTSDVDYYEEDGFRLDFIQAGDPGGPWPAFATHIGNYYNVGNAVIHSHWLSGNDGDVTAVEITKVAAGTFDLNYFILTSNQETPGASGSPTGNELAYIEGFFDLAGTMSSGAPVLLPVEQWGFPATQIYLGANFDAIQLARVYVTNQVNCFGMDEFYIDEDAPEPFSTVPEPSTLVLSGSALAAVVAFRRRRR
jgi:hypothetical protein